ncbi:MAG TPA: hypothetical protein VFW73_13645, partial [Lacipirellulaceae bacterium]|nr:hypothetical protein [Lacipirellulaceae bacterium]
MVNRSLSRSTVWSLAILVVGLVAISDVSAQTFVPTSGTADWNNDANWSSPPFPNSSGAAAIIPEATDDLTINLNQSITLGSLDINKSDTVDAITTIATGAAGGMLTFDGGTATLTNATSPSPAGNGVTIINAPIAFTNGMTVIQNDDTGLQLMNNITGT